MIEIPPLEPHCGSWVVSRKTGEVVGEFFERSNIEKFNPATCFVETALQYLVRINREAKECTCPAKDMPFGRCCKA